MSFLQGKVFVLFFGWTIALLVVFDFFEVLRRRCKIKKVGNFIGDVVFFVVAGVGCLLMVIIHNSGIMRGYILLSICAGMIVYVSLMHQGMYRLWSKWWNGIFWIGAFPKKTLNLVRNTIKIKNN